MNPELSTPETETSVERKPRKRRKNFVEKLAAAGYVVEPNSLQDLREKQVPDEDGTFPPPELGITLPIQEMTRKQYNNEVLRHARLLGFKRYLKSIKFDDLKYALARDDSPKALNFLAALLDPENAHLDFGTVAMKQGISLNDLMTVWRNDRLVETFGTLFTGAPKVAAHAVEAAQATTVCCHRCDGAGEVLVTREAGPVWIVCPNCAGKGTTQRAGDAKAREVVLKATGIIKADPGTTINITTGISAVESVLDELERLPAITVKAEAKD
jgi:ribosomal protein L37AE/L43A